jgi:hypothetical protein
MRSGEWEVGSGDGKRGASECGMRTRLRSATARQGVGGGMKESRVHGPQSRVADGKRSGVDPPSRGLTSGRMVSLSVALL